MAIRQLPDYIINRLKAGEVVERPVSVLKELVENSLDAGAKHISICIKDGGKSLIMVQDDGSGIEISDMDKLLHRYSTSKMPDNFDFFGIRTYGFRGEALASIAEVSMITIQSKTAFATIGTQISNKTGTIIQKMVPVDFTHGTVVTVENLFHSVPARLKFLRSSQTEYFYCYNYVVDIALCRPDVYFIFQKNNTTIFDLKPTTSITERVKHIFKKDRSNHLRSLTYTSESVQLEGIIGDTTLRFATSDHIRVYVNKRPIQDKVIRKAVIDAYKRQLSAHEYPFACIFLTIEPTLVDVNVHPRKLEVKFVDPHTIYSLIFDEVVRALGLKKFVTVDQKDVISTHMFSSSTGSPSENSPTLFVSTPTSVGYRLDHTTLSSGEFFHQELGQYRIVGQIRNTYIVVESKDYLYYIDQHALAERIAFEKLKIASQQKDAFESIPLLQSIKLDIFYHPFVEDALQDLRNFGFDMELLSDTTIVIYGLPKVFVNHAIDIEKFLRYVFSHDEIGSFQDNVTNMLEIVFATKACKSSVKAGDTLHFAQIQQMLQEAFAIIPNMFVCQHGRPFFIQIEKKHIDALMHR